MNRTIDLVAEFHLAFDAYMQDTPEVPEMWASNMRHMRRLAALLNVVSHDAWIVAERECLSHGGQQALFTRVGLMAEELAEVVEGFANGDIVEVLDGLTDLQYVTDGTWLALGLADVKDQAFAEVHRSNMTKLVAGRPIVDSAGKVQKPAHWSAPNLAQFVTPGR